MSARHRARGAADRGHDLRVVREPGRAQAERGRRRDRDRELRDRARHGRVRPGRGRARAADRRRRGGGLQRASCPSAGRAADEADADEDPTAPLRRRLLISARARRCPVLLMSMIPALQFDNWQWLSLNLATPVVLWGGWPFHKATWANLKHAAATMDTLISVGVLSAWLWSLYALFLGDAGMPDMRMSFDLHPAAGRRRGRDLSRDGLDRDHLHPRGPLLRGAREAPRRRCAHGAARARRKGRGGDRLRPAPSAACRWRSSRPATASWSRPARRSRQTASSRRAPRRST